MAADEKLRADARENRDRILDVARDALAADPQVSLNAIAKAAGVGPGTLYRHFPNREALVLGVYRNEIDALAALAPALIAKHPPVDAFRKWCDRLVRFGKLKHGVADLLDTVRSHDQAFQKIYSPLLEAVRQLVEACERSGDILPGTDAEDVLTLIGLLWRIPPTPAGEARVKRLIALVFRGLGVADSEPAGNAPR